MKKLALVIALGTFAFAGVQAAPQISNLETVQTLQDRVKIEPEDLPQVVKDTILDSEETKSLTISEAYQVTDAEGTITYEVTFGVEEEALTKKYDSEGNEITES